MGRRLLLNLLLVAVAIGLALLIYLQPGKAPDSGPAAISNLDPDAVSSIRLTRLQAEPIEFSRRDGRWFIQAEPELPADDFQINTLLALATAATDRHYPASTLDLEPMGLLPPQATVVLGTDRFELGSTDPIDKRRYILSGTTVNLVPDRFQHLLNARYTNFVDRRLLPADAVVTALSLPGLSLTLDADNHWQLQPEDPAVSAAAIRTLVSAWENARALYVREYDGDSGQPIAVQLQGSDQPLELFLRTGETDIILARPDRGIQYHLPAAAGSALLEFTEPANE
ncbi:MAG: DUF4340 domain-containing protein [Gammaproteobacteria bacterium]